MFLRVAMPLAPSAVLSLALVLPAVTVEPPAPATQADTAEDVLYAGLSEDAAKSARAVMGEPDEWRRAAGARGLARRKEADDVVRRLLETDTSPRVRATIVRALAERLDEPRMRTAVEGRIERDADAKVVLDALEALRRHDLARTRRLLRARVAGSPAGDAAAADLAEADERWISLVNGNMLPGFLRVSPPTFSVVPRERGIRVAAFGDYGTGSEPQRAVAGALLRAHKAQPFDFGVTLGDNFYPSGMDSPHDPRWKTWWEDLYGPLGIELYVSLGNHDWYGADSPAAELLYAQGSRSFKLPAPYYTYTAGPAQFFAVDTNEMSAAQRRWLDDALAKSTAPWKIVYGHHPIYSDGAHGDTSEMIRDLLPILRGRAHVYLCGHEHDMQHLQPEDGVHFFRLRRRRRRHPAGHGWPAVALREVVVRLLHPHRERNAVDDRPSCRRPRLAVRAHAEARWRATMNAQAVSTALRRRTPNVATSFLIRSVSSGAAGTRSQGMATRSALSRAATFSVV